MIIGGKETCGKSTELIRLSSESNKPILCPTYHQGEILKQQASYLGLKIPEPIYIESLLSMNNTIDVLIDDIEVLLKHLLNVNIIYATTRHELKAMSSIIEE